jgi:uncharacterized protein with LGFP repeats
MKNMEDLEGIQKFMNRIEEGAFLVVKGKERTNVMTIGWALIGVVWRYLGGAQSPLGNPTGYELPASPSFLGTRGNYRNFAGGQVIWHATGNYAGQFRC